MGDGPRDAVMGYAVFLLGTEYDPLPDAVFREESMADVWLSDFGNRHPAACVRPWLIVGDKGRLLQELKALPITWSKRQKTALLLEFIDDDEVRTTP